MRTIYQTGFLRNRLGVEYARQMLDAGAKIHAIEDPLERMMIMDERVAMVPIDPDNSSRGALIVTQPGLIAGFIRLFWRLWDDATTVSFDDPPAEDQDDVTDQDRAVLELLAAGNTDESAARTVGISVRHLRRKVARLMERLNATSRFEAGVEAARRGWL
ncbi:hypothetical protein JT362_28460 [Actinophytocola sp. S1-96]|uniref:HTH luxR-type domain-containing protein n=2 Tax=Actinophytocola gossypii TaxID=2812003 RepID=A0ABT2JGQ1_9PSEU|nr:hypothetical protein [Actinophytocola gossypii]